MSPKTFGRSLKLFLVDGTSSGIIVAEMGVSSLRVLVANRTSLPELLSRSEAASTGVYLLLGRSDETANSKRVYVGEGDSVKSRLSAHDSDPAKDFFERVAFVVSKDDNLTKAHGRYLESRLLKMIARSGDVELANWTSPDFEGLPEADIADMERVLGEVVTILPVLGFDLFGGARKTVTGSDTQTKSFDGREVYDSAPEFVAKIKSAEAVAIEESGSFVLLAGSTIQISNFDSLAGSLKVKKENLREQGILKDTDDPDLWLVSEDVTFSSPSYASAFVAGRSDNGRTTWKTRKHGITYAEWRKQELQK